MVADTLFSLGQVIDNLTIYLTGDTLTTGILMLGFFLVIMMIMEVTIAVELSILMLLVLAIAGVAGLPAWLTGIILVLAGVLYFFILRRIFE